MRWVKVKMQSDHHPITVHFYRTHLGFDRVPKWHSRSRELIAGLTELWDKRQECYYLNTPNDAYRRLQRHLSHSFGISYQTIAHLLGVCSCDPSNPMGILVDYFDQARPKLKRSSRG
jgi:hypothetical protein